MRKLLMILGTPVDDLNMDEALNRLEGFIDIGRRTGKGHQIATVNADFVVKALHDEELRRILQDADMATADGMPLVWGSRLLGTPLRGRVTGADMVPALAKRAAQEGYSIYFLGAAPGIAQKAASILKKRFPGLRVAGIASPSPDSVKNDSLSIVEACKAARPDILLVALGNPKQEKWISLHAKELAIPVMMGVGGTLDFIAGTTKRAPHWMQKSGLEWLHRLAQEPRRLWKRYVADFFGFGLFFLWQWWYMRPFRTPKALLPRSEMLVVNDTVILNVIGRLDSNNQEQFAMTANRKIANDPFLIVNLSDAEFLDSTAIGTLVALTKQARDAGGRLWITSVPPQVARILELLQLNHFFDTCDSVDSALEIRKGLGRARTSQESLNLSVLVPLKEQ